MLSFNPAEAEEGFKSSKNQYFKTIEQIVSIQPKPKKGLKASHEKMVLNSIYVSIQPKPKKGLKDTSQISNDNLKLWSFNPAEAEEGFKSE